MNFFSSSPRNCACSIFRIRTCVSKPIGFFFCIIHHFVASFVSFWKTIHSSSRTENNQSNLLLLNSPLKKKSRTFENILGFNCQFNMCKNSGTDIQGMTNCSYINIITGTEKYTKSQYFKRYVLRRVK